MWKNRFSGLYAGVFKVGIAADKKEKAESPYKQRIYGYCKQRSHLVKRWLLCINECWLLWCGWQDLNLHAEALAPKASASANSATPAFVINSTQGLFYFKTLIKSSKILSYTLYWKKRRQDSLLRLSKGPPKITARPSCSYRKLLTAWSAGNFRLLRQQTLPSSATSGGRVCCPASSLRSGHRCKFQFIISNKKKRN